MKSSFTVLAMLLALFQAAPTPARFPLTAEQKTRIYKQLARIERIKQAQNEVREMYHQKLTEELAKLRIEEQKSREELTTLLPAIPDGKQLDDDLNLVDKLPSAKTVK
jgi:hypothetical protein